MHKLSKIFDEQRGTSEYALVAAQADNMLAQIPEVTQIKPGPAHAHSLIVEINGLNNVNSDRLKRAVKEFLVTKHGYPGVIKCASSGDRTPEAHELQRKLVARFDIFHDCGISMFGACSDKDGAFIDVRIPTVLPWGATKDEVMVEIRQAFPLTRIRFDKGDVLTALRNPAMGTAQQPAVSTYPAARI